MVGSGYKSVIKWVRKNSKTNPCMARIHPWLTDNLTSCCKPNTFSLINCVLNCVHSAIDCVNENRCNRVQKAVFKGRFSVSEFVSTTASLDPQTACKWKMTFNTIDLDVLVYVAFRGQRTWQTDRDSVCFHRFHLRRYKNVNTGGNKPFPEQSITVPPSPHRHLI